MVESAKNCPACDVVLRPNAVFCHHCGRSLSPSESSSPVIETQNLSAEKLPIEDKPALTETIVKTPVMPVATVEKLETANNGAAAARITNLTEAIASSRSQGGTSPQQKTPRAKRYVSRTEYVWEESTAPTARIILFSLLALLLVALLLWFNNFLR